MESLISGWLIILMMSLSMLGTGDTNKEAITFQFQIEEGGESGSSYNLEGAVDLTGEEPIFYIEIPDEDGGESIYPMKVCFTKTYLFITKEDTEGVFFRKRNNLNQKSYLAIPNVLEEEVIGAQQLVDNKAFEELLHNFKSSNGGKESLIKMLEALCNEYKEEEKVVLEDNTFVQSVLDFKTSIQEAFPNSLLEITLEPQKNQALKGELVIKLIPLKAGEEEGSVRCKFEVKAAQSEAITKIKQKDYEVYIDWPNVEIGNIAEQECLLESRECLEMQGEVYVPLRKVAETMQLGCGYDVKQKKAYILAHQQQYPLQTINVNQIAYVSLEALKALGFGVNRDNGYEKGYIILSKPVAFGGVDVAPIIDFMKVENSYAAEHALMQDVMNVKTLNLIIDCYKAECGVFPGLEGGNMPKEGLALSYITYRILLDEGYIPGAGINFATKDLKWESKLIDSKVKIIYDSNEEKCFIQIPKESKELIGAYEKLSKYYQSLISIEY